MKKITTNVRMQGSLSGGWSTHTWSNDATTRDEPMRRNYVVYRWFCIYDQESFAPCGRVIRRDDATSKGRWQQAGPYQADNAAAVLSVRAADGGSTNNKKLEFSTRPPKLLSGCTAVSPIERVVPAVPPATTMCTASDQGSLLTCMGLLSSSL